MNMNKKEQMIVDKKDPTLKKWNGDKACMIES